MTSRTIITAILATAFFGFWAYVATSNLRTAVVGAETIEGTIAEVEGRRWSNVTSRRRHRNRPPRPDYYRVYVTFTNADGKEITRPAQADGPGADDTELDTDVFDDTGLGVGDRVALLYHAELGDLVWIDSFWLLWIFPLFLCLVALVATIVLAIGALSAVGRLLASKSGASSQRRERPS